MKYFVAYLIDDKVVKVHKCDNWINAMYCVNSFGAISENEKIIITYAKE